MVNNSRNHVSSRPLQAALALLETKIKLMAIETQPRLRLAAAEEETEAEAGHHLQVVQVLVVQVECNVQSKPWEWVGVKDRGEIAEDKRARNQDGDEHKMVSMVFLNGELHKW